jgi:hypothetical protein
MASAALTPARFAWLLVLPVAFAVLWLIFPVASFPTKVAAGSDGASIRQPVLVELFTSEGCSDCPPADALLARLDATQFVPGAQAIVLSEHVTYWNHLGWRDPFSFDAMSDRQHLYASFFALDDIYTPQAVVDGSQQLVGNQAEALTRAVAHAAQTVKPTLVIQDARWSEGAVTFAVRVADGSAAKRGATLMAALAEDATHSEVARGENAGRTLHHVAVVRVLKNLGPSATDGHSLRLKYPGEAQPSHGESASPVRLVVFLADRRTSHVLAVAEQTVTR